MDYRTLFSYSTSMESDFLTWLTHKLQLQTMTQSGIGDDCATMQFDSNCTPLITTDALVDLVHFDLRVHTLEQIGWKSLAVNLSDLAAMGAKPKYAVISLVVPDTFQLHELQRLYEGILDLASQTDTLIIGGDFNTHSGPLTISATAIGQTVSSQTKYRFTSQPGDRICITGPLGKSILGHHLNFMPCLVEGAILASSKQVHALTDVTDGLVIDLHSILPGDLGAVLYANSIPCREPSGDAASDLKHALYDGEDFELLFTVESATDIRDLTIAFPRAIYEIGLVDKSNQISLQRGNQDREILSVTGYEH
ncbi:MAG: hypothetical protein CMJ82_13120 [Planctomycetaceae bacterium]|nr:hypothetical protein [Planctomycetaceae bacterium]